MTPREKALENTVGKGQPAGNQHFLLFPQCFLTYERETISTTLNLSSAKAFNLEQAIILLFGKELTHSHTMIPFDASRKQAF